MKKTKRYLFICIAALSLLMTGCGQGLYELTPEEEALIVHYSAYVVAKHNIQQKDGVSGVVIPEGGDVSTELDTEQETESTEQGTEADPNVSGDGETQVPDNAIELADVIGHSADLTVSYEGSAVQSSFEDGAYFIEARNGKTYYVMKFKLTNITEGDVVVDNIPLDLSLKLVSDGVSVKSEWTALSNDFCTYKGTIPAGESVETLILFELTEAQAAEITAPKLEISIDNVTKNVKL